MSTKIFITGATGYIGGSVLAKLLESKKYDISALVRAPEKAEVLKRHGVKPIVGTLDDADIISQAVFESDVTIEVASSDHLGEAKAIVAGLERKLQKTGKKGKYIQTSGTGILVDLPTAGGMYEGKEIYSDKDSAKLNAIPVTQPHRNVDTFLIDNSEKYDLVIVSPPCIYGRGVGFKDLSNPRSVQIPLIIKTALWRKKTQQVGNGLNIWSFVHIADVAQLYEIVVERILAGTIPLGKDGYIFCETADHKWSKVCETIAEHLYKNGHVESGEVLARIGDEEIKAGFGFPEAKFYVGGNSICRAEKARELGWKPSHKADGIWDDIRRECDQTVADVKAGLIKLEPAIGSN